LFGPGARDRAVDADVAELGKELRDFVLELHRTALTIPILDEPPKRDANAW